MMCAAKSGHKSCVQALAEAGANLSQVDSLGKTALMLAEDIGHKSTVALIQGILASRVDKVALSAVLGPAKSQGSKRV